MADFGTPETWNMKVGQFIEEKEFILPQKKPQEIVEQRRKERLSNFLRDYPGAVEPETRTFIESIINREDKAEGGRMGFKVAGFVNQVPIDTGKVKPGYITGQELEELTGIPNLKNKAKELMYAPKESKRQKNIFGDFYRKDLKARYFNIGQGGKFGTLHYKKPTAKQIKQIKEYHLRTGAKYGLTDETIKGMKQFYNDPTLRKFIRKGEIVPEEVLKAKGININTAANITYRLAQHLNGKEFTNVNVDIPRDKTIGKKIFETIAKAPFGNVYQQKAYQNALNEISEQLGPDYFKGSKPNMDLMKREARRILNREGVPTFDPTVKGSTGFNINEIIGVKTGARVPGMAPYSQFINIMEGKLNAEQYGNFVRQFEKFANRMQTENNSDVIKDYKKYTKKFLENNPGVKETDLPKFSLKSPEAVYGKKRIAELADSGIDIKSSYDDIGYTVDVGKKTRTLKEFITDPKNIGELKKFGAKGALAAGVLSLPAVVQASEDGTKEDSILPEAAVATAAAAPLATKKGRSIYGTAGKGLLKALQTLGTPFGVVAGEALIPGGVRSQLQEEGLEQTLRNPLSYAGLPLASIGAEAVKNPALQRILNLGLPLKVIRAGTPVGLGLMGISALVDSALKAQEEFEAMSPEEQKEFLKEQEEFGEDIQGAAEGGIMRLGLAEGPDKKGLKSPGRRKFMKDTGKLAGILALIPYLGKFIAPVAKSPAAVEGVKLGADKLMMLVDKIKKFGVDKTKNRATQDLQEVTVYQGKDGSEYELVEDLATGDVRVTKEKPGMASYGDETFDTIEDRSVFEIKKGQGDEMTRGTPPDEYDEAKEVFGPEGTVDDIDEIDDRIIKEIDDEIN